MPSTNDSPRGSNTPGPPAVVASRGTSRRGWSPAFPPVPRRHGAQSIERVSRGRAVPGKASTRRWIQPIPAYRPYVGIPDHASCTVLLTHVKTHAIVHARRQAYGGAAAVRLATGPDVRRRGCLALTTRRSFVVRKGGAGDWRGVHPSKTNWQSIRA